MFSTARFTRSLTRLSPISRHYQSLAMSLNSSPMVPSIHTNKKDKEQLSSLRKFLEDSKTERKKVIKTRPRMEFMKNFLGPSYSLPDELLLMVIHPDQHYTMDRENGLMINSVSLEQTGRSLLNLQISKFLLHYGSKLSTDETEIFDSMVFKNFHKPQTLNRFITYRGLDKHIQPIMKTHNDPVKTAQMALFVLIGSVCSTHGREAASRFIDESIITGRGGLMELVSRR